MLGFTHYEGQSRKGYPIRKGYMIVKRLAARSRLRRTLKRVWMLCKLAHHAPMDVQRTMLARQLQGHYGYSQTTGKALALAGSADGASAAPS